MKFVIGKAKTEVSLTLEECVSGRNSGMVFLKANGRTFMGFKDGKYRLFSDACDVDGLIMEENGNFIVRSSCI